MFPVQFDRPITATIKRRYSCRSYLNGELEEWINQKFAPFLTEPLTGIWGSTIRIKLLKMSQANQERVRLGTYGFISGAREFFVGIINSSTALIEFGHLFEQLILYATEIGLGTCWLGGSFTRSTFSKAARLQPDEYIPAISPVGFIASDVTIRERVLRKLTAANNRKPWEMLFFDSELQPLTPEKAGSYAEPLEMVRLAPSASNKQPWRIVQNHQNYHFYLKRTPKYWQTNQIDLQQIDLGIALCHFELTAREKLLSGNWKRIKPDLPVPQDWEYIASWN
jgi:hypothetical protein